MYLPFLQDQQFLYMGLRRLQLKNWLEPDDNWLQVYLHKQQVLNSRYRHCVAELPESLIAQKELQGLVRSHLLTDHANEFGLRDENIFHRLSDTTVQCETNSIIDLIGRWISDDICILQDSPGGYRLTAASLCSPSHWLLEEKLGQTLDDIHASLPGYRQSTLSRQMNRFFSRLRVENPVWRANWSINSHPGLMQRPDTPHRSDPDSDPLWLRVERQSLRRLPETQAICFTIRIYLYALEDVLALPEAATALKQTLENLNPAERRYKSLASVATRVSTLFANDR